MASPDRPVRPPRPQHELTVVSAERVGPHLVRVVLTGDSLADFGAAEHTDAYVKLRFTDADGDPITRTYTVRAVDREARLLTIDFVTHGDVGYAGPWAQQAKGGDRIVLMGPGSGYAPDPEADWHLLAGDLSAVPAIAASLEAMPAGASGVALLEVEDPGDVIPLRAPEHVDVQWLVNPATDDVDYLARAVDGVDWREGVQVFAHGERESIKAVRRVLKERGVPREAISISGYWARGRTEDAFQAEKRTPVGRID